MAQIFCGKLVKELLQASSIRASREKVSVLPLKVFKRWKKIPRRKPIWLPTAPSKVLKIPVPAAFTPDEVQQLKELTENYNTMMESLVIFFRKEYEKTSEDSAFAVDKVREEKLEHQMLMEENRKENERVAKLREERLAKEFEEKQIQLLEAEEMKKRELEELKREIEEIVRKEKENSSTFITLDSLDAAIEHAISNAVNYNFSIDFNGNVYWEGSPPQEYEEQVKKAVS